MKYTKLKNYLNHFKEINLRDLNTVEYFDKELYTECKEVLEAPNHKYTNKTYYIKLYEDGKIGIYGCMFHLTTENSIEEYMEKCRNSISSPKITTSFGGW